MKAIILAAGKGTRLGALTEDTPKPMLLVNTKPILERIILWLKENGIREIGINLFTKPKQITDYFAQGEKLGVALSFFPEKALTGTAGALGQFQNWLGDDENFVVVYGDVLTNQNLTPLIERQKKNQAFATLLIHRRASSNSYIKIDTAGRIQRFLERPENIEELQRANPAGFLVNSAVQVLSRRALTYILNHNCFDLPRDVYMKTHETEKIYTVLLEGERVAIDSAERLTLANKLFT